MKTGSYRGRFAPSPTGPLHFGSLVAALGSFLRARSQGGRWLVRIEDIDPPREVPGMAQRQLDALAAFGLQPDEPPLFQSRRKAAYEVALAKLGQMGVTYECRCRRRDLEAFGDRHPSHCLCSDPQRPASIRIRVPDEVIAFVDLLQGPIRQRLAAEVGDFVLRRADGEYAYQLAVVVDDAEQGITEVVRGADLLDSTPRQIWLQRLLGFPAPGYLHLPLALDSTGRKLSKSEAALPVHPSDPLPALRAALAFLGQAVDKTAVMPGPLLISAVSGFSFDKIPRQLKMVPLGMSEQVQTFREPRGARRESST